jgi:hypothetical protein
VPSGAEDRSSASLATSHSYAWPIISSLIVPPSNTRILTFPPPSLWGQPAATKLSDANDHAPTTALIERVQGGQGLHPGRQPLETATDVVNLVDDVNPLLTAGDGGWSSSAGGGGGSGGMVHRVHEVHRALENCRLSSGRRRDFRPWTRMRPEHPIVVGDVCHQ